MAEDYCELCDLPLSQCVHGRPPPPEPVKPPPKTSTPRVSRTTTSRTTSRTPGRTTRSASSAGSSAAKPPPPRRRTPPEDFKEPMLAMLRAAGGELPADRVFDELEQLMGERLRTGDHETMPSGELRWQYAARSARRELMQAGLVASGQPGVWRLTPEGMSGGS